MSHPIPLHPDADLAVVLHDLRQDVAAWGDEGLVTRFFRASICLMLLSILDMLIELLADFRAGRLPPVLPALERSTPPSSRVVGEPSTIPPEIRGADDAHTIAAQRETRRARRTRSAPPSVHPPMPPPRDPAAREIRAHGDVLRAASRNRSSPEPRTRHSGNVLRGIAFYPSHVPRSPVAKIRGSANHPSHAHFVTITERCI